MLKTTICAGVALLAAACVGVQDDDEIASTTQAETTTSCLAGEIDMLDWMTLDENLRATSRLNGVDRNGNPAHPLYTLVETGRFWWMKTDQGDTWDVNRYDDDFIYFEATELGWHSPWACKPGVDITKWAAARRCLVPGDPSATIVHPTGSRFRLVSSAEEQLESGDQGTEFHVTDVGEMTWGSLGTLPTLRLDYRWNCWAGTCHRLEQYFLTQTYGLVRWRYFEESTMLYETTFASMSVASVPKKMYSCETPPEYLRASSSYTGAAPSGVSFSPSIDDTGDVIAFVSVADNLVADDGNGQDVFVFDATRQETRRVSTSLTGMEANGASRAPAISRAGTARYVTFESDASDLVPGDTNGMTDVFVFDRELGTTTLVSVGLDGPANGASSAPSISADGCRIAFESTASNLIPAAPTEVTTLCGTFSHPPDTNGLADVYVRDRCAGTTTRASITNGRTQAALGGMQASIDDSGRFVAYTSGSSDLVAGDVPQDGYGYMYVFVYDYCWGVTTALASKSSTLAHGNNHSYYPRISGDGRFVAFVSGATNLAAADSNDQPDVFVHDLWRPGEPASTTAPSLVHAVTRGGYLPAISSDGRFVAFVSTTQPTPGAPYAWASFVYDHWANDTIAPRTMDGTIPTNAWMGGIAISTNVRTVAGLPVTDRITLAFESTNTNIVPGADTPGAMDVFTRTVTVPGQ